MLTATGIYFVTSLVSSVLIIAFLKGAGRPGRPSAGD
jgi:hypothetical protein